MKHPSGDARGITTPTARTKLEVRRKPYWKLIDRKTYLGYRRNHAGGTWVVRVYHEGRYPEQVIGTADDHQKADGKEWLSYSQAQRLALDKAEELRAPKSGAGQKVKTVADLAKKYLEWQDTTRRGADGTRALVEAHILPAWGDRDPAGITGPELAGWRDQLAKTPPRRRTIAAENLAKAIKKRGRKAVEEALKRAKEAAKQKLTPEEARSRKASANRVLGVMKAMLNWGVDAERQLFRCDPYWREVKPFEQVNEATVRYLEPEEAQRLANACPPDFRALVQGALYTGARYGELTKATVADFKSSSRTLELRHTKNGKVHHARLIPQAVALLEQLTRGKEGHEPIFTNGGKPWGKNHYVRPLEEACAAAKIKPAIGFHILRHTFASALAHKGVSLQVIGKLMGHRDFRITEKHYAHIADKALQSALDANLPDLGGFIADSKVAKLPLRAA